MQLIDESTITRAMNLDRKISFALKRIEEAEESLFTIMFASHTIKNMTQDLLDLSQMEKGMLMINNDFFNLNIVIDKALKVLEHISELKNITFEIQIADDSKQCFENLFSDEGRFQKIVVNFLTHALKGSNWNS